MNTTGFVGGKVGDLVGQGLFGKNGLFVNKGKELGFDYALGKKE